MDRLSKLDYILICLIALGLRSVIDANIAQAFIVMSLSGLVGYSKYLASHKQPDLNAELRKELDEVRDKMSSITLKNTVRTTQAVNDAKRWF